MQVRYEDWAEAQPRVERRTRPRDAGLSEILQDPSYHRWVMFENLRGRFLDFDFREAALRDTKNRILHHLSPTQRERVEELRSLCGSTGGAASQVRGPSTRARLRKSERESETAPKKPKT